MDNITLNKENEGLDQGLPILCPSLYKMVGILEAQVCLWLDLQNQKWPWRSTDTVGSSKAVCDSDLQVKAQAHFYRPSAKVANANVFHL